MTLRSIAVLLEAACFLWVAPLDRLGAQSLGEELDALVPSLLEEYSVPGAAVAITSGEGIVLLRSFGVRRAGEGDSVEESTVFQAASLSKPVVAYGAHLMVRDARLDLDRPLADYLEAPYVEDPRAAEITARMVLSHSTGFPNWRPGAWGDHPGVLRTQFEPGSEFRYSGEGYVYLQRVLETLSGEPLEVYLRRRVLEPLGMHSSSFVWEERFEAVYASPHNLRGDSGEKQRPSEALASGTLQTTASDYARFLQAILSRESPSGEDGSTEHALPLSAESIEQMLEPQSEIDERLGWSLGWGIELVEAGGNYFWQWGDDGPFKALAAGSRERDLAVVVFANGQWGLDVARPIVELVLGERAFLDFQMVNYRPKKKR